jgi:uncharacterized protein (DUF488 family)
MRQVKPHKSCSFPPSFFTLGYQSHTFRTLLTLLLRNHVSVLVDVRQNPMSRKAGFSKEGLEQGLTSHGIEYIHYPCLGTPPKIRKEYILTGDIQRTLSRYEKHLQARTDCLKSLLKRTQAREFCLLCLESDYTSCHRSVIATKLAEMTGCQPIQLK